MALNLDGNGDNLSNSSFTFDATEDFSLFVWNYVPSPDQNSHLFALDTVNSGASDRIQAHAPWSDGILYFDYGNATAGDGRLSYNYTGNGYLDKWVGVGLLATSAESMKIYLNGAEVASQSSRGQPLDTSRTGLRIGSRGDGEATTCHKGRLAWFTIWNVGLTPAEFAALGKGAFPLLIRPGKIKCFHPIFGVSSPEPDWGPGKFHGTVNGNPTRIDHPPGLFTDFFGPKIFLVEVTGGAQTISGVGAIASGEAFGTTKLNQNVNLNGIASGEAFGTAKLNMNIALTGLPSAESFGVPVVTFGGLLISNVGNIASGQAFGTLKLNQNIVLTGIPSGQGFGAHQLNLSIKPQGIASAQAFGTVKLNQNVNLNGISSQQAFGNLKLNQKIQLVGIASQESFGLTLLTFPANIRIVVAKGSLKSAGATGGADSAAAFGTGRGPSSVGVKKESSAAGTSDGATASGTLN